MEFSIGRGACFFSSPVGQKSVKDFFYLLFSLNVKRCFASCCTVRETVRSDSDILQSSCTCSLKQRWEVPAGHRPVLPVCLYPPLTWPCFLIVSGIEFRSEGRWPGTDRRARPWSVRRCGQDEARAQRPDHGCEGEGKTDQRTVDFCFSRTSRAFTQCMNDRIRWTLALPPRSFQSVHLHALKIVLHQCRIHNVQ